MVHCHFLLPSVDFPTANVTFFFFFLFIIVAITIDEQFFHFNFPVFLQQLLRLKHLGTFPTLREAERLAKHFPTSAVTKPDCFFLFFSFFWKKKKPLTTDQSINQSIHQSVDVCTGCSRLFISLDVFVSFFFFTTHPAIFF